MEAIENIFNSEGIVFTKNCCLGRGNWSWALLQTTTMNIASFVTLIIMHFPSNVSRKCLSFLSNGFLNCFWRLVINHPHLGEWIVVMDMKRKKSCGIRTEVLRSFIITTFVNTQGFLYWFNISGNRNQWKWWLESVTMLRKVFIINSICYQILYLRL